MRRVHVPTIKLEQARGKDKPTELNVLAINSDRTFPDSGIVKAVRG